MTSRPADSSATEAFLDAAYSRMVRLSILFAIAGTIVAPAIFGVAAAVGFLAGSVVAILNFVWLHRAVNGLVDRMLSQGPAGSHFRIVLNFLGRYGFLALIAYAIFKSSAYAFYAFLCALPLPILAAMCEAVYEAVLNVKDQDSAKT